MTQLGVRRVVCASTCPGRASDELRHGCAFLREAAHTDLVTLKDYKGLIWIGEAPGQRIRFLARSGDEAVAKLEAEYGKGHVFTLYNEEQ